MDGAVRDHQTLFEVGPVGGLPDGQLLERFVERREEVVFETIVRRHGPMVWGVCRRVLRDHHDAEEAFQTTFLVLGRKAGSLMVREKLGNWLYGVAYQTALKARAMRAKRWLRESQVLDVPEPEARSRDDRDGLIEWLDRELRRLPEKYRTPIILCELEGRSHKEAAGHLGWPVGTVASRLSRARAMLTKRLTQRGVSLSAGGLAAMLAPQSARAGIPAGLTDLTVRAARLTAEGEVTTGMVLAGVAELTREVLRAMLFSQIKTVGATLLVAVVVVGGGVGLTYRAQATVTGAGQEEARQEPSVEPKRQAESPPRASIGATIRTPRVASARPDDGATGVDPATSEFRVTFDQDMDPESMSIVGGGPTFPADPTGKARWVDARTLVLPLKLKPGQDYQLSLNSERFQNFTNRGGTPAVPYPVRFRTGDGPTKGSDPAQPFRTPRVVRAQPDDGAVDIDPATSELRVAFDQDMRIDSMSIVGGGPTFPADPTSKARWVDARTLVLPLKLKPGQDYQLSFNSGRFVNFRNTQGRPAVPYPIHFRTSKGKGTPAQGATDRADTNPPRVVSARPDDGAADVDPATSELRVTFDQDMNPDGYSVVGGGPTFPADPTGKVRWIDARTLVLPLKLKPGQDYQLSLNSGRFQNFRNRAGRSATPYPIRFRTGAVRGKE